MDDEEGAASERRGGCMEFVIGVDKGPNPAAEVGVRSQLVVGLLLTESNKFLHATLVEKQRLVRMDLQGGGELEPKPSEEDAQ